MALIAASSKSVLSPFTPTKTILSAADTLVFTAGTEQELIMYNTTASAVVITIDGSLGTTVAVHGTGGGTFSVVAGLTVTVPANGFQIVRLETIPAYCAGVVAVTGGVGIVATIIA